MAEDKKPQSEIDYQAKKNIEDKFTSAYKKSKIKEHNIRAAFKNERKNRPDKTMRLPLIGDVDYKGDTKKSKSLSKALRKEKKTQKFIRKHEDILEERGVSGSAMAGLEKDKLLKLGVYRDKKGGQVLEGPRTPPITKWLRKKFSNKYKKKLTYK